MRHKFLKGFLGKISKPVSLMSALDKLIEAMIKGRIRGNLGKSDLLER